MKIYIQPLPNNFNHLYYCPRTYHDTIVDGFKEIEHKSHSCLVDDPDLADIIIWAFVPADGGIKYENDSLKALTNKYPERVVVVDNSDEVDQYYIEPEKVLVYLKRSIFRPVTKDNYTVDKIQLNNLPKNVLPWNYCVTDGMLLYDKNIRYHQRPIDITILLRKEDNNRKMLLQFGEQIKRDNSNLKIVVGEVSKNSRSQEHKTVYCSEYLSTLQQSKINIVCQPQAWIGCSREWESLSQGCVTFVDKPFTTAESSPIAWQHYVPYSLDDLGLLYHNINRILTNEAEGTYISMMGNEWALKNHRSINRCQYIINEVDRLKYHNDCHDLMLYEGCPNYE